MEIPIAPIIKTPQITPQMVNLIAIGLVLMLVSYVLFKLHKSRIFVEVYEKIKGGYVQKAGRYRIVFDKQTNMHCLISMMGGQRLPAFSSKHYQKVESQPIIGILRQIKLIKVNKHTYYPITPPDNQLACLGEVQPYNSLGWVRTEIIREFEKKIHKGQLLYLISILAPIVVILAVLAFFGIAIYTDKAIFEAFITQIETTSNALEAVMLKRLG